MFDIEWKSPEMGHAWVKQAQTGSQFCWSWAARLVCLLSHNTSSARANAHNTDTKSKCIDVVASNSMNLFLLTPLEFTEFKLKITPHKLSPPSHCSDSVLHKQLQPRL